MMKLLTLILVFGICSPAYALDEDTQYLPAHGKDVTTSLQGANEIRALSLEFVKALEGKDLKKFKTLVTPYFLELSGWDEQWKKLPSTMSPNLVKIEDFFIMENEGKHYVRYSVKDLKQNKVHTLPSKTWYRVVKKDGKWKMDAFLPNLDF